MWLVQGAGGRPPRDLTDLLADIMAGEVTDLPEHKENKEWMSSNKQI